MAGIHGNVVPAWLAKHLSSPLTAPLVPRVARARSVPTPLNSDGRGNPMLCVNVFVCFPSRRCVSFSPVRTLVCCGFCVFMYLGRQPRSGLIVFFTRRWGVWWVPGMSFFFFSYSFAFLGFHHPPPPLFVSNLLFFLSKRKTTEQQGHI